MKSKSRRAKLYGDEQAGQILRVLLEACGYVNKEVPGGFNASISAASLRSIKAATRAKKSKKKGKK